MADQVLCRDERNPNQTTELSNLEAGSWDGKRFPDPLKRCPAEQGDLERPTSQDCRVGRSNTKSCFVQGPPERTEQRQEARGVGELGAHSNSPVVTERLLWVTVSGKTERIYPKTNTPPTIRRSLPPLDPLIICSERVSLCSGRHLFSRCGAQISLRTFPPLQAFLQSLIL